MNKRPDAVFILDTKKEHIAVTEANKLGIPIIAVVDTNVDPDVIQYPIPGNDDAIRANALMARVIAEAIEEGRFISSKRNPQAAPAAKRTAEDEAAFAAAQQDARRQAAAGPGRARSVAWLPAELADDTAETAGAETVADDAPSRRRRAVAEAVRRRSRRPTPTTETTTQHGELNHVVHREGCTGAAPGHWRRHDGRQEGPRGQRRRHGSIEAVVAREGPRRQRQARRPRQQPGPRGAGRSTATSAPS